MVLERLEGLAIWRALQLWATKLQGGPVLIRSDSSVALAMAKKLASSAKSLNYIASEIAILVEKAQITKLIPQHVPGKLIVEADWLSRLGGKGANARITLGRQVETHHSPFRAQPGHTAAGRAGKPMA